MSRPEQSFRLPLPTAGPLEAPTEWKEMRGRCPVAAVELPSGDKATYLTRYHDVRTLLSDPRFTRPTAQDNAARIAPDGAGGPVANGDPSLIGAQTGETHMRQRRLLSKHLTAKRVTTLRPSMVAIADSLIDDMLEHGQPADLKAKIGFPLPVYVICDLLGVPVQDRDRFSHWSNAFLNVSRYSADEARASQAEFAQYMSELIVAKRARPSEDLLSALIKDNEADGDGLSEAQLVGVGMGLLVAGHETTTNMIGKMVAMLLAERTHWEQLLADPSLVRTAVDETLRFDPNSGFGLRRYLTDDVDLGGELVPSASTVFCSLSAANRDEQTFAEPDRMDLSRTPNPHLAFGAGPHSCLGQTLARAELQIVLEALLRRLPTLRLAQPVEELRRLDGLLVGGLQEVPVRW
ncbi:cytochrome P450 [Streptomyces muensis]|uniref:Cytochrome P450 n=1 Tax=Streptomyces muensis TaxID=1077944 RepID=A0A9X1TH34_STRM4|nr:cytochrome P450 [Streptomyces muensis]MCF1592286.1 cytochrome P450 [Streptomyces muensis]